MVLLVLVAWSADAAESVSLMRVSADGGLGLSEREGEAIHAALEEELVAAGLNPGEDLLWGDPVRPGTNLSLTVDLASWTCDAGCRVQVNFRLFDASGTALFHAATDGTAAGGMPRKRLVTAVREAFRAAVSMPAFVRVVDGEDRLPSDVDRLEDLEGRVSTLERLVTDLAPSAPTTPSPEHERQAGFLLKEAANLYDALDLERAREVVTTLREDFPETRAAKAARRLEEELAVVGSPEAPLVVEKWFQGSAPKPGTQVTLYVFFEVWCPHCKREVPKLEETSQRFAARGLAIVGLTKLTRDVTEDQLLEMVAESHLSFAVAKEQGTVLSDHYAIAGIPAAVAVRDGVVVWRGHPAKIQDAWIERWLDGT